MSDVVIRFEFDVNLYLIKSVEPKSTSFFWLCVKLHINSNNFCTRDECREMGAQKIKMNLIK